MMRYFSNSGQQMFEIILADEQAVFHALLVNHIPTDGKLTKDVRTPLTELGSTDGVHPIAHGDDGIEVVGLSLIFFPSAAVVSILEITEFSINSPSSNIFFRCLLTAGIPTSNRAAIDFCVAQMVSSLYTTWTPFSLPSNWKIRNSAVLFLISNFFAIFICL